MNKCQVANSANTSTLNVRKCSMEMAGWKKGAKGRKHWKNIKIFRRKMRF